MYSNSAKFMVENNQTIKIKMATAFKMAAVPVALCTVLRCSGIARFLRVRPCDSQWHLVWIPNRYFRSRFRTFSADQSASETAASKPGKDKDLESLRAAQQAATRKSVIS